MHASPSQNHPTPPVTGMPGLTGLVRPLVLQIGHNTQITGRLEFTPAAKNGVITSNGATWRLKTAYATVQGCPDAMDVDFTWTLEAGSAARCAVAVAFEFDDWTPDSFVFAPAAVYNGNRFAFKDIPWPTYLLYGDPQEQRLDAPTTVNDCPRLKQEGPGRIDLTTGSVATPLLGFHSPTQARGWMVMTTQGNRLGNHGLSIDENTDQTAATFMITSPAIRQTRADGSHLISPSGDAPVDWRAGDSASIKCRIYAFDAPCVTDFLRRFREVRKALNPSSREETLPHSEAWKLLGTLYRNHRWDEEAALYRLNDPGQERIVQIWQLGWVGGGQVTLPLLQFGNQETRERAWRNLDTIFSKSQAKSGFFYTLGDGKRFLSDKSRPHVVHNLILLRKNADWLYMAQKQFQIIETVGDLECGGLTPLLSTPVDAPTLTVPLTWKGRLRRLADAFVRIWQAHGQFGQWADVETGELKVGGSTNCAILCGALALASRTFKDTRYLDVAEESARKYYQDYVLKGYTCGGPAEALSCPDSESAFALLESFMTLHEITGNSEWVQCAADLIPICASWTVSYDFLFPPDSALGRINAHSCGSVWASVQNKHSAPGICTWSGDSLLKYYRATGDRFALDLLADIVHGITQYISREDRPVGTMKPGGICERVNLSDWEGTENVGGHIFDSCSWCETAALLTIAQIPGLYIRPDLGEFTVFDHITAEEIESTPGTLKLKLANPTPFTAAIRVLVETAADRKQPLPLFMPDKIHTIVLAAGATLIWPVPLLELNQEHKVQDAHAKEWQP